MEITFDPAKDAINRKHDGISLADAQRFDWASLVYQVDTRKEYGEERYRGFGYIDGRLHMVAFTFRDGTMRVISLRKANPREVKAYEQAR
ncbi:BrnT family toxin [Paraburkholderia sp. J8-2]|uniref:BrnT family toxin n=1 Tax=Paraburkholderia sp. J8-2 TaxID=2805440 RepID=UPI002AB5E161|nr:BrnT family toxin [Paraburkholderia sp. J8-2]